MVNEYGSVGTYDAATGSISYGGASSGYSGAGDSAEAQKVRTVSQAKSSPADVSLNPSGVSALERMLSDPATVYGFKMMGITLPSASDIAGRGAVGGGLGDVDTQGNELPAGQIGRVSVNTPLFPGIGMDPSLYPSGVTPFAGVWIEINSR